MVDFAKLPFIVILISNNYEKGIFLKQEIKLGAYGWRHDNWNATFYPEDLPAGKEDDWRLAYYSNEFDSVLVPASYWQSTQGVGSEAWLGDVHENFKFLVECNENMFEHYSLPELTEQLKNFQSQLSALVFLDEKFVYNDTSERLGSLFDSLKLDVFVIDDEVSSVKEKWLKPVGSSDEPCVPSIIYIENDLSDMRQAKSLVEDTVDRVINSRKNCDSTINLIVSHPQLQATDLARFRSVLQIMGH